jgi:c-di-GMP-related signal transduction protein
VSLFRNKIRKPVSITLTPEHHKIVDAGIKRLSITRADFIALLINEFGRTIEIPTALSRR